MILSEKEAREIADKLLGYIKADDAQIIVTGSDLSHLRFAANTFTTSGSSEDLSVGVTVWIDRRKGSASANQADDASLRAVVEQAEQMARISPVDQEYLPTLGAQSYQPAHGFVQSTARIDPVKRAKAIGEIISACEEEKVIGAGFHQSRGSGSAFATKNGAFGYHASTLVSLSVTARTQDGTGSGYFLRSHFNISKLDTARIGREAIRKALGSRGPRSLEPGIYTVVLEPQAVADLLIFFSSAFDARRADEGRSAFSAPGGRTKVGERVFDQRLSVYSDPWHPELPGAPYTSSGVPAKKFYLVRNGVLETLVYSRFWADKKGKEPTPGPTNIIMESAAPAASLEDMIADTKRGLLVGRFWYLRPVDPRTLLITGLTRDGVWYIEDGKVQYPVGNFRFNQSILEMLAPGNVELIGAPERVGSSEGQGSGAMLLPALKVKEFNFASKSEAV